MLKTILIIVGIILLLLILLLLVGAIIVFRYCYKRFPDNKIEDYDEKIRIRDPECIEVRDMLRNMPHETLTITGSNGLKVIGYFYKRNPNNTKLVILSHGWKGQALRDCVLYSRFYFERDDFDVLVVTHLGHYPSEGRYIGFGALDGYNIKLWVDEVNKMWPHKYDIYLHGVSMGANAVMMSAKFGLDESVKGIIEDCGFTSGYEQMCHVCKAKFHIPSFVLMPIVRLFVKIMVKYDCKKENTIEALTHTNIPILFIHGDSDNYVPTWMTLKNYELYEGPKELMIVKGAAHAKSYRTDRNAYVNKVIDFCYRYESKKKQNG